MEIRRSHATGENKPQEVQAAQAKAEPDDHTGSNPKPDRNSEGIGNIQIGSDRAVQPRSIAITEFSPESVGGLLAQRLKKNEERLKAIEARIEQCESEKREVQSEIEEVKELQKRLASGLITE